MTHADASHADDVGLLDLDEEVLVKVLLAAKRARTLVQLASLSKQLCSLARSRVPVWLRVWDKQQAGMVIRSHAQGRPPFSGCTTLWVAAGDLERCGLAKGVLSTAQQWTALERLYLCVFKECPAYGRQQQQQQQQQVDGPTLEVWTSSLLLEVAALCQLRHLVLETPALSSGSVEHIMQLTQLTSMQLIAKGNGTAGLADLGALAALTNLVQLQLHINLSPYLPGGPEEPYNLPSSLTSLLLDTKDQDGAWPMALWVQHIPGCPALQSLRLDFSESEQHGSTHPNAVVQLLAQHCPQLRKLYTGGNPRHFGASGDGLWSVDELWEEDEAWRPDASLAALTGLQTISSHHLMIDKQEAWQHLAQLTALSSLSLACLHYAPPLYSGTSLAVLELEDCHINLTGHQVGCLLLACASLETAVLSIGTSGGHASQPTGAPLPAHPTLTVLRLGQCSGWGGAAAAAKHFAALAPVLGRLASLSLDGWPAPSSRTAVALPDLSACTALTSLQFEWVGPFASPPEPYPEDLLSMVAPLVRLDSLEVRQAPWVNARVALVLQSMLPRLRLLHLVNCGRLSAARQQQQSDEEEDEWEDEEEAAQEEEQAVLIKVHDLLRPDLQLFVSDWDEM